MEDSLHALWWCRECQMEVDIDHENVDVAICIECGSEAVPGGEDAAE